MSTKGFAGPMSKSVRSLVSSPTSLAGLLLVAACGLPGCGSADSSDGPIGTSESEALSVCATSATVEGIDVSDYQGKVSWASVKASGRVFAFARVSDGATSLDTDFATNWAGIKNAGLIRGAYQFFRASESGTTQANVFLSKVGTLAAGDLPPVLDVEVTDGESSATIVSGVQAWIARVEAVTGKTPIVYAAPGFWNGITGASKVATEVGLWDANWGVSCPSMPSGFSTWKFWQHSATGTVPGISGKVDLDSFDGTLAQLQALAGVVTTVVAAGGEPASAGDIETPAATTGAAYGEASR